MAYVPHADQPIDGDISPSEFVWDGNDHLAGFLLLCDDCRLNSLLDLIVADRIVYRLQEEYRARFLVTGRKNSVGSRPKNSDSISATGKPEHSSQPAFTRDPNAP